MKKAVNTLFAFTISILLAGLVIYTIHDIQTAEGIGYFFTLKLNLPSRLLFDILADVILSLLCLALLLIPVLSESRKSIYDFCSFAIIFVAFMPQVSLGEIIDQIVAGTLFSIELDSEILAGQFIEPFRALIPLIILIGGAGYVIKNEEPRKSDLLMLIVSFTITLISIPFSGLYSVAVFFSNYIFVIVLFHFIKSFSGKLWPIHIILLITCMYRILSICNAYSL